MNTPFSKFGLAVATALSVSLVACNETPSTSTTQGSVALEPAVRPEPEQRAPTMEDIAELVASGDRDEALRVAESVLAPLSASEHNILLDRYFLAASEKKNNGVAIVLAESISNLTPQNGKSAYIAGLAYWQGITVEKDAAMVAKYWDVEALKNNKTVQSRLAEAYGNSESPIYDPVKAAEAQSRAQEP